MKAQGKDPKGRGGADATVTFRLEPSEIGSKVLIETDLTLSGSVAQYGRGVGMIQSVASQLIGQFAKALEEEIAQDKATEPATEESGGPATPLPPPAEPQAISGFSLFFAALGNWLKGSLGNRFGVIPAKAGI